MYCRSAWLEAQQSLHLATLSWALPAPKATLHAAFSAWLIRFRERRLCGWLLRIFLRRFRRDLMGLAFHYWVLPAKGGRGANQHTGRGNNVTRTLRDERVTTKGRNDPSLNQYCAWRSCSSKPETLPQQLALGSGAPWSSTRCMLFSPSSNSPTSPMRTGNAAGIEPGTSIVTGSLPGLQLKVPSFALQGRGRGEHSFGLFG